MASSKDFKQAIREGRLNDAFVIALGNAPELHITTWVASPEDNQGKPPGGECLRTHVNLVEGEIINEIGEKLIGDELYTTLQKFHLQQVTQGHQTISQNLQSLQQMFRLLAILQKQQNGEEYTPPMKTWKIDETSIPPTSEANLSLENNSFDLTSESEDLSAENENNDLVNELLSLDDLDLELEPPSQNQEQKEQIATGQENMAQSTKNDEDWGDWLEEDSTEANSRVIGLDDMEIEQVQDWEAEDWGDDTEFMPNPNRRNGE
jgi:flagellar motility protein MotE (MotC chaperone)